MSAFPAILDLGRRPLVMGIVNMTPDSFSGDGLLSHPNYVTAAVAQAEQMVADGADILDIGGESTRPGAEPVEAEEERQRVVPVIAALHAKMPQVPLSVDTMKPNVAAEALEAGACIINDVSRTKQDKAMLALAASTGVYIVLMHNRTMEGLVTVTPGLGSEYHAPVYENIVSDVMRDLRALANRAKDVGIPTDRIILDPGFGFGKTVEQNLLLINELDKLKSLGYPLLAGPSRKSFIGRVLEAPPEDRLEGTAATIAICALRGASILRVHDVKEMTRIVKMVSAVKSAA